MQVIERLLHGGRAEGGTADAQHDERIELIAHAGGDLFDVLHDFFLIIGQLHPAGHALAAVGLDGVVRALEIDFHVVHGRAVDAILHAEEIAHHVVDIKTNLIIHF